MNIDETIEIVKYNESWPLYYKEESLSVKKALGDKIISMEHFGSTAVPGLDAKPIIDILIGVESPKLNQEEKTKLRALGYQYCGEAGIKGRLYLRKRGIRSFNLAIVKYGSDLWSDNLLLKNYLINNPDEARRYGEIKREIYQKGAITLLAYSKEKDFIIKELLQKIKSSRSNE